jgi:hypothetical protein
MNLLVMFAVGIGGPSNIGGYVFVLSCFLTGAKIADHKKKENILHHSSHVRLIDDIAIQELSENNKYIDKTDM